MLKVVLVDGHGKPAKLKVNGEGEIGVVVHPHPPKDEVEPGLPFRRYFTNSGSNDMRVDGSSTPVIFEIAADEIKDTYIRSISINIVDAGATLAEFGNLSALANGMSFVWETTDLGTVTIADEIKTNYDFSRLGKESAVNIIASNVVGTAEGVAVTIDLADIFGVQYGLRLRKASTDKLCFVVNDNLSSGISEFDILGYGFKF